MGIADVFLVFVVTVTVGSVSTNEPTYFVSYPRYLRAGFPIQLYAEILKNPNPVNFIASLGTPAKEIDFQVTTTLVKGEPKLLIFDDEIPLDYDGTTDFTFSISGVDAVTNETLFLNTTDQQVFKRKSLSLFIQTDKGIYKPSQTIKFRAVVTDPDLLPYNGTVSYKLTDPDDNIILQKKNAVLVNGIAGSEFSLGRYSTLGLWKISYECQGNAKAVTVTVDEYELPKFEIEFSPNQNFLHPGSEEYSGKFSAKFTFGEPVKGEASLTLQMSHYRYDFFWGQRSKNETLTRQFSNFNGEAVFNIPIDKLKEELEWNTEYDRQQMSVTIKVKDKNSLKEIAETTYVDLVKVPYKFEKINAPNTAKPGFFYTGYIKVTQYDGSRVTEVQKESMDMRIKYTYNYRYPRYLSESDYLDMNIDKDGYVAFTMRANNSDFNSLDFQVKSEKYQDKYFLSWSCSRYDSPSNTYIQLSTAKTSLKPDEKAVFDVLTSRNNVTYSIMIMARGIIVKQESYTPNNYEVDGDVFKFQYEFTVTKNMAPAVAIVFYYIVEDGEVVAENVIINVETTLPNMVALSTNVNKTDTGTPVSITVRTTPGSSIALRAIDRSVILQKEGNDITTESVLQDLSDYNTVSRHSCSYYCYFWRPDGSNAKEILSETGISVFTDAAAFVNSKSTTDSHGIIPEIMFEMAADSDILFNKGVDQIDQNVESPTVRKNFPETWIWDETIIGSTGMHTYSVVLPDTTTTWEISAFAVSHTRGLGVLDPDAQIVASRDFFISLTLPPTMVSGEVLSMRTTVYNFLNVDVEARLTLENNEWYEVVMNNNDTTAEGPVRTITIPSQDGKTEIFTIKFLKVGTAKIKVTAISELASDAIERTLPIKPEGIERDISRSVLIERDAEDPAESVTSFEVEIPSVAVEGSVYGKLSVSGSVMGSSWNNLGNLLRMPSGCGEQTMLNFAPDVFISLYLKKAGLLEGEVKRKSTRHITAGYQNELRYQHKDGSFSAFQGDTNGSTWLTAFVVKSFIGARELDADLAHEDKIDPAISFLLSTQHEDGTFREYGHVSHRAMQGGVSSQETMTAYVLIALTEGGYKSDQQNIIDAVNKAKQYLEERVGKTEELYAKSVIAYALALSGSSVASTTMADLDNMAKVAGNMRYWAVEEEDPCNGNLDYCWGSYATSSDIEMTSYAFLTLMKLGRSAELMPIARWIIKQRSSIGGYRSTQDTVMAIQALSVFAELYLNKETDLTFDVKHSADENFASTMSVTDENAIVLQSEELPPLSGVVNVTTKGSGLADLQLSYTYYLPLQDRANEPFVVTPQITQLNGIDQIQMEICSSINKKAEKPLEHTGMFVVAVTLPSGYSTNDKKASADNKKTRMVELDGNEVSGYFDELLPDEELCFTFTLDRYMKVGKVKPQAIRAFDYYEPEHTSIRMYIPHESDDLCDTFGKDLLGCPGGSASSVAVSMGTTLVMAITAMNFAL